MTTFRVALQMIVTPETDTNPAGMQSKENVVDLLYGRGAQDLDRRFIPVFDIPSFFDGVFMGMKWTKEVHDRMSVTVTPVSELQLPKPFKNKDDLPAVSACSNFLYHHAVEKATNPSQKKGALSPVPLLPHPPPSFSPTAALHSAHTAPLSQVHRGENCRHCSGRSIRFRCRVRKRARLWTEF